MRHFHIRAVSHTSVAPSTTPVVKVSPPALGHLRPECGAADLRSSVTPFPDLQKAEVPQVDGARRSSAIHLRRVPAMQRCLSHISRGVRIAAAVQCTRLDDNNQFLPEALPRKKWRANILPMDQLVVSVRAARSEDAAQVARVYIDSWHDAYAGILPSRLLCAMTPKGQTARWRAAIRARGRESVLVAECGTRGVVGMTSFGPSRDGVLGFDGEIYTLYVDPDFYGCGSGRALLQGAFSALRKRGQSSCVIWAHAKNPVRFFYEALGGRLIAERTVQMMGDPVPENAFGWRRLAIAERSKAH